jgi:hypothetical protein
METIFRDRAVSALFVCAPAVACAGGEMVWTRVAVPRAGCK